MASTPGRLLRSWPRFAPKAVTNYAGPLIPLLAGHEKLTACGVVLGFGLLQWRGIRIGDVAQQVTSLVKALALIALAVVALFFSQPAAPAATRSDGPGANGIAAGSGPGGGGHRGDAVCDLHLRSLVATVNALVLIASRVPFAMSRDGLLPTALQRVNPGGTPVPAMWTSIAVALALIATNTFNTMVALLAFMFVANYAVTFTTFFVLRRRQPDAPRPFRVPLYPVVPALALFGSLAFIVAALASDTLHSLWALALVGHSWPVYRLFRRKA